MIFKHLCAFVLWTKVASALEGLSYISLFLLFAGAPQTDLLCRLVKDTLKAENKQAFLKEILKVRSEWCESTITLLQTFIETKVSEKAKTLTCTYTITEFLHLSARAGNRLENNSLKSATSLNASIIALKILSIYRL